MMGQGGVKQIIEAPLLLNEKTALSRSASILQDVLHQLAD
jgi:malate/lactate dehydrogenase